MQSSCVESEILPNATSIFKKLFVINDPQKTSPVQKNKNIMKSNLNVQKYNES